MIIQYCSGGKQKKFIELHQADLGEVTVKSFHSELDSVTKFGERLDQTLAEQAARRKQVRDILRVANQRQVCIYFKQKDFSHICVLGNVLVIAHQK